MTSLTAALPKASKETLATTVYDQLRQDILTVAIPPGAKLNIRDLCERFSVGLSPVREALSRLSKEDLVRQADHRGFTVAPLSQSDLDDLTRARCAIDGLSLRQSIEARLPAWEEEVVLAYHRLSRTPRFEIEDRTMRSPLWERAHKAFHMALVSGCGSRRLTAISADLFEAAERYRHLARLGGTARPRGDEHRPIMEAALAHDADAAVDLLTRHFHRTAELVRIVLPRPAA